MTEMNTPKLTIREGGFYRTRDGMRVGPLFANDRNENWPWLNRAYDDDPYMAWRIDGRGCTFNPVAHENQAIDLIAEWTDVEPDTPQIDLTNITTPFGLLPPETQAALKEHDGTFEMYSYRGMWVCAGRRPAWDAVTTYRATPQPKVETVTNREMYLTARGCIASNAKLDRATPVTITYTATNGAIDPASYRVEARG